MELIKIHKEAIKNINDIIIEYEFYLAGGTAVYYYLKHRYSEDLDFFTNVTSFFYYPYRVLYEFNRIDSLNVANLLDILPMKVNAVINRGSKKDFIDIYFIMKHLNLSSEDVLKICKNKFGSMNEIIFCKSLVYFEDADREITPKMIKKVNWEEVKDFLKKEFLKIE